jgi:outer membrane protein TolC
VRVETRRIAPWLGALAAIAACSSEPEPPARDELGSPPRTEVADETSAAAPLARPRRLVIDLPTAIELAGGRNPVLAQARVAVLEAVNTTLRDEFSFLPTIYPLFRAFSHKGQAQTQGAHNVNVTRTNFLLQVLPAFQWDPGPVVFAVLASRRRESVARARLEAKGLETTLIAAASYLDLVRAEGEVAIARAAVERAQALLKFARTRVRAGAAVRVEELRAETDVAQRDQELAQAEGHVARASALLVSILLLDPDVELVPKENVPPLVEIFSPETSVLELTATARARRPEVEEGHAELEAREQERWGALVGPFVPFVAAPVPARAAYPPLLPTLTHGPVGEPSITRAAYLPAFGQWGPGGPWNYGQFYGPDSPFGDTGRTGLFGPTLGSLRFSQDFVVYTGIRFGPGGVGDIPEYRKRALALQAQHVQMDRVQVEIVREVAEAHAALVTAHGRLDAARMEVVAAEEAFRLERDRFEKGVAIQLDVIDAHDVLVTAQTRDLEAIVDYDVAQYQLLRAVGSPPPP